MVEKLTPTRCSDGEHRHRAAAAAPDRLSRNMQGERPHDALTPAIGG
jgi:hypothetical protein